MQVTSPDINSEQWETQSSIGIHASQSSCMQINALHIVCVSFIVAMNVGLCTPKQNVVRSVSFAPPNPTKSEHNWTCKMLRSINLASIVSRFGVPLWISNQLFLGASFWDLVTWIICIDMGTSPWEFRGQHLGRHCWFVFKRCLQSLEWKWRWFGKKMSSPSPLWHGPIMLFQTINGLQMFAECFTLQALWHTMDGQPHPLARRPLVGGCCAAISFHIAINKSSALKCFWQWPCQSGLLMTPPLHLPLSGFRWATWNLRP